MHFYSQFDSGVSVESNNASLEYGHLKDDVHFQGNKRLDTKANRVIYFEKCLEKLAEQLNDSMSSTISEVLFPYRVGCGKAGVLPCPDSQPSRLFISNTCACIFI